MTSGRCSQLAGAPSPSSRELHQTLPCLRSATAHGVTATSGAGLREQTPDLPLASLELSSETAAVSRLCTWNLGGGRGNY